MMKMKTLMLIACAIPCLALLAPTAQADGLKIGVVHLSKVFDAYEKTKQLDAELKLDTQKKMGDAAKMRDKINALQKKMNNKMLSLEKRMDLKEQFEIAKLKYDIFRKKTMALAERQQILRISDVYKDIRTAVNAYAKENGYDMIIRLQEHDNDYSSIKSLEQEINLTTVLYAGDKIDITKAITDKLNKAYKK